MYYDFVNNKRKELTGYYYDGNYIFENQVFGSLPIDQEKMLALMILIMDNYKYINPQKIEDYQYVMKLNNLSLPSEKWIKKQEEYSINMSYIDSLIIDTYTKQGAFFINSYIREGKFIPEAMEVFEGLSEQHKELFNIFYKNKISRSKGKFVFEEEEMKEFSKFFMERLNNII